jgi:8-oxo-dGTP diphosphatase
MLVLSAWLVADWQGTPTNAAPDEHDAIRWFPREQLPPLAHGLLGAVLVDAMRIRWSVNFERSRTGFADA